MRKAALSFFSAFVLLLSPALHAQSAGHPASRTPSSDPAAEARRHYNLGKTAYDAGRYADGALAWEAAAAIKPHAATLYSAALAWEKASQSERAADDFVRAMAISGLTAQQTSTAKEKVAQLEATLGSIDVTGPEGMRVQLDALTEVPLPARLHAAPGLHVLSSHGSRAALEPPEGRRDVTLEAGKTLTVELTQAAAIPKAAPPELPPPEPPAPSPPPPRATPVRVFVGVGLVGMGVATLGAGAVMGIEALGARDAYNAGPTQAAYGHAESLAMWTNVGLIAGGLLAVGGGVLAALPGSGSSAATPGRTGEPDSHAWDRRRRRARDVLRPAKPLSVRLVLLPVTLVATGAACSLGLNHALIGEVGDASAPVDAAVPKAEVGGDAADSASPLDGQAPPDTLAAADGVGVADGSSLNEGGQPCTQNSDCTSTNACLTGRCDTIAGRCAFDLCPSTLACTGSTCDSTTNACGPPAMYGFQAATISVATALGSGCAANNCVAASFPFVYVGTPQGVVAVNVANPGQTAPSITPVSGIPFLPAYVVGSGARVYFIGSLESSGGSSGSAVPIAWIDPPADPTAPLVARSALATFPVSMLSVVFPDGLGGVYLEGVPSGLSVSAALITAPLTNPTTIVLQNTPLEVTGEKIVGASQSSFVVFRLDTPTYAGYFGLVTGAGSATAMDLGEQNVTAAGFGEVYAYRAFAGAPDGSFLFNAAAYDEAANEYTSMEFGWVIAGASSTTFSGQETVEVESYSPPAGYTAEDTPILSPLAGPVVWLDANRALVTAAAHEGTDSTSVQVVTRATSPPSVVLGDGGVPNRVVLATTTSATGVAASQSPAGTAFGYVLTTDPMAGAVLTIIAPDCP